MAGSDEETVEVGFNKERHLCGLAGDEDDDDLGEDREALFGGDADDHSMDVDDGDVVPPAAEGGNRKRNCPSTSPVCYFLKLHKILS